MASSSKQALSEKKTAPRRPSAKKKSKSRKRINSEEISEPSEQQRFRSAPTVSNQELLDEDGRSDRRFRQFLYDFSVLGWHLEFAREYLASRVGLSAPQYNCAMVIAYYQGSTGVSVSHIAQHLHVSTAFITSEGKKLERAGLVEKLPNPDDGRGILLRLTPLGEMKLQEVSPHRLLVNDHLFLSLSRTEFRHLASTVAKLIENFSATSRMLKYMQGETSGRKLKHDVKSILADWNDAES